MTHNRSFRRSLGRTLGAVAVSAAVALPGLQSTAQASGVTTPLIVGQAGPSGFPVGVNLWGTASLGWANNPTGTITFRLFSPFDPSCTGAPLLTSNTPVTGNGYYNSDQLISAWAGTYRWTATYSGDANNASVSTSCGDAGAAQMVAKRTPTLSAAGSLLSLGAMADTAAINGATPVGTISFSLYGPGNLLCAGAPIFTSVKSVAGNGSYTSDSFVPTLPGTYQWTTTYSGDANNNAAGTICTDPANTVVAGGSVVAGFSLSLSPLTLKAGAAVTVSWSNIGNPTAYDWIALYAAGAPDSAVKAWRYTGGTATGSGSLTVPWGNPPGTYEVRLFANNSYTRLGTATVTVVS